MVAAKALQVKQLKVHFSTAQGLVKAVDNINFTAPWPTVTTIIGESGCGKSVLGQALLGMLTGTGITEGEVYLGQQDVLHLASDERREYYKKVSLVPQNPSASLNPLRKLGKQMQDILDTVGIVDADNSYKAECLRYCGLDEVERVLSSYPFEISGGMQQRVLCAMSISVKPQWIIADEPTKGLDEQVNAIVIENLQRIKALAKTGMVIITHDIKLARELADRVGVMYSGQLMELGAEVLTKPLHPYTQMFLRALPEAGFNLMPGRAPAPNEELVGCKFASRCPYAQKRCFAEQPGEYEVEGTIVRCFRYV